MGASPVAMGAPQLDAGTSRFNNRRLQQPVTGDVAAAAGPNSSIVVLVPAEAHERQSDSAEGLPLLLLQVTLAADSV